MVRKIEGSLSEEDIGEEFQEAEANLVVGEAATGEEVIYQGGDGKVGIDPRVAEDLFLGEDVHSVGGELLGEVVHSGGGGVLLLGEDVHSGGGVLLLGEVVQ